MLSFSPTQPKASIKTHTSLYIFNCYSTLVHSVLIKTHGIFIMNGLGNTNLTDISLCDSDLEIFYYRLNPMQRNGSHVLRIVKFS